jgi:hypothetical protein
MTIGTNKDDIIYFFNLPLLNNEIRLRNLENRVYRYMNQIRLHIDDMITYLYIERLVKYLILRNISLTYSDINMEFINIERYMIEKSIDNQELIDKFRRYINILIESLS